MTRRAWIWSLVYVLGTLIVTVVALSMERRPW